MRQLIISLALLMSTMLHAQKSWCIVDAANPDVPLAEMAQVAYLLTNDYDSQLCLVCKDGTVFPGLTGFTFRQFDLSAIQPAQPRSGLLPCCGTTRASSAMCCRTSLLPTTSRYARRR